MKPEALKFHLFLLLLQNMKKNRVFLFSIIVALALPSAHAQKVTLGSCTTHDGGQYQGEMQGGKPYGKGKTRWNNGDLYEGEYVKGLRQGDGIYTFADGEKYDGKWFKDQQHGMGTYYFSNNNRYVGLWYRDYQQDHGIMYYYNGDVYDGNWERDILVQNPSGLDFRNIPLTGEERNKAIEEDIKNATIDMAINPKSYLQECMQADKKESVTYRIISEIGAGGDKTFVAAVYFEGSEIGRGSGKNKKAAETEAARDALKKMSLPESR